MLHCPNASSVAAFEAAVRRGDIWWHAFPHNAELAAADVVREWPPTPQPRTVLLEACG